jgi:hypothetical protein
MSERKRRPSLDYVAALAVYIGGMRGLGLGGAGGQVAQRQRVASPPGGDRDERALPLVRWASEETVSPMRCA